MKLVSRNASAQKKKESFPPSFIRGSACRALRERSKSLRTGQSWCGVSFHELCKTSVGRGPLLQVCLECAFSSVEPLASIGTLASLQAPGAPSHLPHDSSPFLTRLSVSFLFDAEAHYPGAFSWHLRLPP